MTGTANINAGNLFQLSPMDANRQHRPDLDPEQMENDEHESDFLSAWAHNQMLAGDPVDWRKSGAS